MQNIKKVIYLCFFISIMLIFYGCNSPNSIDHVVFESKEFNYDGKVHSLSVNQDSLPDGASVTYTNNDKVDAGEYEVIAEVVKGESKVELKATLKINKIPVYFSAIKEQSITFNGEGITPSYKIIDNDFNVIKDVTVEVSSAPIYPGVYEITLHCLEHPNYIVPADETVTLSIVEPVLEGISFKSKYEVVDGNSHSITIDETKLPNGYTCEYENNTASTKSTNFATCTIKDSKGNVICVLQAILKLDNPDNVEFNKYVDEFFVLYLEGDQLAVNIYLVHPANFGILEHYDAVWYTYSNEDTYLEGKKQFEDLILEFESFDVTALSENDMISYRCIKEFLYSNYAYYENKEYDLMGLNYIDQFGGMPADFATYMEAYAIRSEIDAQDIVSYTKSLPDAFSSYIQYVKDKEASGYAISQYTIDEMVSYLAEVLNDGENYYLIEIVCNNIDNATCLTYEQKALYKEQFTNAMHTEFISAYQTLHDYLDSYVSPVTTEGYLQTYQYGKEYYILKLKDLLGVSDIDIDQYIAYLDSKISEASKGITKAMSQAVLLNDIELLDFINYIQGGKSLININDTFEMLSYLKEFAKSIVPELKTDPAISLSELDPTVQQRTTTVAYYMKSALDSTDTESIHTNPYYLNSDINDTLSTLAHEGYPGHLYNFVYTKESNMSNLAKIMTNTCYGEGWATYVSLALYNYIKENTTSKPIKYACDYLVYNEIVGYALYARIDAGIHLQGWTVNNIAAYLASNGFNADSALDVYRTLIEIPTQYVSYGFGICYFYDIHQNAKKALGKYYSEIDFNKMILDLGWCNMETLHNAYLDYVNEVKWINKIA